MSTFLVAGATGKQGGAVVDALLSTNPTPTVKALTRNTESPAASALKARGVTLVKGNLNDKESLVQALSGVDGAFLATDFSKDGVEGEVVQGKTFVDAFKASSAKHLLFSSVGSADVAKDVPHFHSKNQIEEYLRANLDGNKQVWTVLRPVAFMDNFPIASAVGTAGASTFFRALIDTDTKLQWIACRDIGTASAKILTSGPQSKWIGKNIELAGDVKTFGEVMETFGQVGGGKPWVLPMPRFLVQKLAGYDMTQMFKFFNAKGYTADVSTLRQDFPDLYTWKEYIQATKGKAQA